jgi:hypothetical protein
MHGSRSLVMGIMVLRLDFARAASCLIILRLLHHRSYLTIANKETQPSSITCPSCLETPPKNQCPNTEPINPKQRQREKLKITTKDFPNAPTLPEAFQTPPQGGDQGLSQTSSARICIIRVMRIVAFPAGDPGTDHFFFRPYYRGSQGKGSPTPLFNRLLSSRKFTFGHVYIWPVETGRSKTIGYFCKRAHRPSA